MDGARLFNAAVALGQPVRDIVQHVDSVGMCVSKGLGAPVGGLLAGSKDLVRQVRAHSSWRACHAADTMAFGQARRVRKGLGGGMRQAGVIAAGALYALKHNVERLAEDHEHASRLAHALAELPGVELDPSTVETNLIWFHVSGDVWAGHSAAVLTQKLAHEGVLISGAHARTAARPRCVTALTRRHRRLLHHHRRVRAGWARHAHASSHALGCLVRRYRLCHLRLPSRHAGAPCLVRRRFVAAVKVHQHA